MSDDAQREQLAFDLAARLLDPDEVLDKHGLTKAALAKLLKNEGFRSMILEYRREWNSPEAGPKRVQIMARMAQEATLADLVAITKNEMYDPTARVAAAREIRNASDAGHPAKQIEANRLLGIGAGGIHLSINLNGTPVAMAFNPQPDQEAIDITPE